jgi:hypothetical protein
LPVQSRADHLCLPRSLVLIVIFASLGHPTAAPFTGNPLFTTVYASSSNHRSHSPPIVGCPCSAFPTNHSPRRDVSASRQPRPLLQPPPFEGTLNSVKATRSQSTPSCRCNSVAYQSLVSSANSTDARARRHTKKTTTPYHTGRLLLQACCRADAHFAACVQHSRTCFSVLLRQVTRPTMVHRNDVISNISNLRILQRGYRKGVTRGCACCNPCVNKNELPRQECFFLFVACNTPRCLPRQNSPLPKEPVRAGLEEYRQTNNRSRADCYTIPACGGEATLIFLVPYCTLLSPQHHRSATEVLLDHTGVWRNSCQSVVVSDVIS